MDSLPIDVVFPEPFTPTTMITKGLIAGSITSGRWQGSRMLDQAGAKCRVQGVAVRKFAARHFGAQVLQDLLCRLDADIRADQARLEFVEQLSVDLPAGEQAAEPVDERLRALRENFSRSRPKKPGLSFVSVMRGRAL